MRTVLAKSGPEERPHVLTWALVRKRRAGVVVPWYERRVEAEVMPLLPRPRTRGDCIDGPRPCPWISCKHNLFLDVNRETGQLRMTFPGRDPLDMPADGSCALDVAEHGGAKLEQVGKLLNVVRERIRQIEEKALAVLEPAMEKFRDHEPIGVRGTTMGELASSSPGGGGKGLAEDEDDRGGRVIPDRFQIGDPNVPETEYLRAFWRVLLRWYPGFNPRKKKAEEEE